MISSRVEFDPRPGIGSREIVPSSPHRVSITFTAPRTGACWISNDSMLLPANGIALIPGMSPVTFRIDLHGDCVQREWFATYLAGSDGIGIIQGIG